MRDLMNVHVGKDDYLMSHETTHVEDNTFRNTETDETILMFDNGCVVGTEMHNPNNYEENNMSCKYLCDVTGDMAEAALDAYFESGANNQPSTPELWKCGEEEFIVLSNMNGVLAVYEVADDGAMVLVEDYPEELNSKEVE